MKTRQFPLFALFSAVLVLCLGFSLAATSFAEAPETLPERFNTGSSRPTLLEFYAEWCSTCKRMEPLIHKIEYDTGENLRLVRLDIDRFENEALNARYEVNGTPTYFLYDENGKLVFKMETYISSSLLQSMVYKTTGLSKPVTLPNRRNKSFEAIEQNKKPLLLISFHKKKCASCQNANGFTKILEEDFVKELSVIELNEEEKGVEKYKKRFSLGSVPSYALIDEDGFVLLKQDKALSSEDKKNLWQYLKLIQSGLPES